MAFLKRSVSVLLGLALLVGLVASVPAADPITVKLSPLNNSGQSGTATLTQEGDSKTKVVLSVTGAPAGAQQPVHIHKGSCGKIDPKPAFPLSPVVNGKSETVLNVSRMTLEHEQYAINSHKSAQDASTYVFCGDIPKMKM
jgi:hypothetical protein